MARGKKQRGRPTNRSRKARENLAYARGVKKGRSLGFDDGWDAAHASRDADDERAVMALASLPLKPIETLAPEAVEVVDAVEVEAVDATIVREKPYSLPIRRLMEPQRFN